MSSVLTAIGWIPTNDGRLVEAVKDNQPDTVHNWLESREVGLMVTSAGVAQAFYTARKANKFAVMEVFFHSSRIREIPTDEVRKSLFQAAEAGQTTLVQTIFQRAFRQINMQSFVGARHAAQLRRQEAVLPLFQAQELKVKFYQAVVDGWRGEIQRTFGDFIDPLTWARAHDTASRAGKEAVCITLEALWRQNLVTAAGRGDEARVKAIYIHANVIDPFALKEALEVAKRGNHRTIVSFLTEQIRERFKEAAKGSNLLVVRNLFCDAIDLSTWKGIYYGRLAPIIRQELARLLGNDFLKAVQHADVERMRAIFDMAAAEVLEPATLQRALQNAPVTVIPILREFIAIVRLRTDLVDAAKTRNAKRVREILESEGVLRLRIDTRTWATACHFGQQFPEIKKLLEDEMTKVAFIENALKGDAEAVVDLLQKNMNELWTPFWKKAIEIAERFGYVSLRAALEGFWFRPENRRRLAPPEEISQISEEARERRASVED